MDLEFASPIMDFGQDLVAHLSTAVTENVVMNITAVRATIPPVRRKPTKQCTAPTRER